jgi:hypothetical protein
MYDKIIKDLTAPKKAGKNKGVPKGKAIKDKATKGSRTVLSRYSLLFVIIDGLLYNIRLDSIRALYILHGIAKQILV